MLLEVVIVVEVVPVSLEQVLDKLFVDVVVWHVAEVEEQSAVDMTTMDAVAVAETVPVEVCKSEFYQVVEKRAVVRLQAEIVRRVLRDARED